MDVRDVKYPVSEIFCSPQGEGQYTGAMMTFIRLAGCTVGKPYPKEKYAQYNPGNGALPIYTEMCTLYDNRTFQCDTDYRVKERLSAKEICQRLAPHVPYTCLTGGEPMMHPILPLVDALHNAGQEVHLETSGTIPLEKVFPTFTTHATIWITVSPKFGILPDMARRANEIKLLVDKDFNPDNLIPEIKEHKKVYLQPINFENEVNAENLKLTMEALKKFPTWRVSLQLHKVLSAYTGQFVR